MDILQRRNKGREEVLLMSNKCDRAYRVMRRDSPEQTPICSKVVREGRAEGKKSWEELKRVVAFAQKRESGRVVEGVSGRYCMKGQGAPDIQDEFEDLFAAIAALGGLNVRERGYRRGCGSKD